MKKINLLFLIVFLTGGLMTAKGQGLVLEKDNIYTIRIEISNPNDFDQKYAVYSEERWGKIMARTNANDKIHISGSTLNLVQKEFPSYKNPIILEIPAQSTEILELNVSGIYSITTPQDVDFTYDTLEDFYQRDRTRLWQQGLFMGVIIVMGLYNLLIFLSVRDISYLYYTLSIFSLGAYFIFFYGFGIEIFWPQSSRWDIYAFSVIIPFTNWSRIRFTYHYFGAETIQNRDKNILKAAEWVCLISIFVHLSFYLADIDFLRPIVTWIGIMGVSVLLLMIYYGLKGMKVGYVPATLFFYANIAFVIGAILFIIRELGYFPDNFFTRYVVQLGVLIQVVLFSLGLSSRFNEARTETARLRLQQEVEMKELIHQQKIELEEKVREQTESLRKLNILKTKVLSIISHDLRNPLISIGSFLNLMIDHKDRLSKEEQTTMAGKVRQSLQYLDQLLSNLLHWSQSQTSKINTQFSAVDLNQTIDNALEYLHLNIELKELDVQRNIQADARVNGDPEMLDFIFRNIIGNAIKFSNQQGVIEISSQTKNDIWAIEILNHGTGMPAEKIRELNSSSSMKSTTGTANEKGSGLGLVICREFIHLHSGTMKIESDGKSWTKVMVSLPG